MKKKIVVLTGAGISAESGLKTFRDAGGLWEGYKVTDVATPEAWDANPEMVLRFYNERRAAAAEAQPNAGHLALVELEKYFDVFIVTQNVDNLHEKAGSSNIVHLHGELSKVRSTADESLIYEVGEKAIQLGDKCEKGSQLRPHIVWFGESVPMMETAALLASTADVFMVIGTSLLVYPAAGLIDWAPVRSLKYIIDPNKPTISNNGRYTHLHFIVENGSTGVPKVAKELIEKLENGTL
jgi:NAD-dependent deacetylase